MTRMCSYAKISEGGAGNADGLSSHRHLDSLVNKQQLNTSKTTTTIDDQHRAVVAKANRPGFQNDTLD